MKDFTVRDWQNGKYCPQHGIPYCTPCFKTFTGQGAQREHAQWYRKADGARRNFFADSRKQTFAAAFQLGENYAILPIEFIMVGDDHSVHVADDRESRDILTHEHQWDISTPEWARYAVPDFSAEDMVLLREMKLFK